MPFGGFAHEPSMVRPVEAVQPRNVNSGAYKDARPNPFAKTNDSAPLANKINDMMNNPLTQMGLHYTKNSLNSMIEGNKSFVQNYVFNSHAKQYFDLDQAMIARKLKFIVFPFLTNVSLERLDAGEADFISRAEFYIPTMSMVSFVLIACFHMILNDAVFDPSNIAHDVTKCLALSLVESVLTKFVFFLALQTSVPFLDVLAYSCYKYVG